MFSIADCSRIVDGLDHPECVVVAGPGVAYAGGEAGQIYRLDLYTGGHEVIADVGGFVAGVTVESADTLIVCDAGNGRVLRVGLDGSTQDLTLGVELTFPNFAVFDHDGDLYFTDSGDYYNSDGRLLAIRNDGEVDELVSGGLKYPNGLALAITGDRLFMVESKGPRIITFDLAEADWDHPEPYVFLPGYVPDGLAVADSGAIYVGCYAPDSILRIGPDRDWRVVVTDPGADMLNRPTNVAFHGNTLLFANLGGYHIGALDVGEPRSIGATA